MQLAELFQSLRVGDVIASGALEVFPLTLPGDENLDCVLIDELLDRKLAEITEVSEGGSVPQLTVQNNADTDALILDGTELQGAKQDRMVNLTLIIGKHSKETIPVSCVESGRWAYRSRSFGSTGRTVGSRLRQAKTAAVGKNLMQLGIAMSDQSKVWASVHDYLRSSGARSESAALGAAFVRQAAEIGGISEQLKDLDAHGAVVALHGRIVGLDLITHRPMFRKFWPALLHGYAIDASLEKGAGKSGGLTPQSICEWLDLVGGAARLTAQKVPGSGQYFVCESSGASGGIATHSDKIVHVMLFAPDGRTH